MSVKSMWRKLAEEWFDRCESVGIGYSAREKIEFLADPPEKKKKPQAELVERLEAVAGPRVWKKNTDNI